MQKSQHNRHPIYKRPKPPMANGGLIVLGVIFWPIALVLLIVQKSLQHTRQG